jgi:hypothetical protein
MKASINKLPFNNDYSFIINHGVISKNSDQGLLKFKTLFEKYTSNAKNVLTNLTKTETPTPTTN